jgi:hypothetical protein
VKLSPWPERDDELKRLCADPLLTYEQIGKAMGLTPNAVVGRVNRMGYRAPMGRGDRQRIALARLAAAQGEDYFWTEARLARLKAGAVGGESWAKIGDAVNLHRNAVRSKACRLGWLTKETEQRRQANAAQERQRETTSRQAQREQVRRAKQLAAAAERERARAERRALGARPQKPPLSANDDALVAHFLATKRVTCCPTGWAYGSDTPEYIGKTWRAA